MGLRHHRESVLPVRWWVRVQAPVAGATLAGNIASGSTMDDALPLTARDHALISMPTKLNLMLAVIYRELIVVRCYNLSAFVTIR